MATKKEGASNKKSRVKVGKLQLDKETVKDLTGKETKNIKGGFLESFLGCPPETQGATCGRATCHKKTVG